MSDDNDDRNYSPVLYDLMLDAARQIGGRYIEWMDQASTEAEQAHWRAEHFRVMQEAWHVDPDSRSAIETHRAKLHAQLETMPLHAPSLV